MRTEVSKHPAKSKNRKNQNGMPHDKLQRKLQRENPEEYGYGTRQEEEMKQLTKVTGNQQGKLQCEKTSK